MTTTVDPLSALSGPSSQETKSSRQLGQNEFMKLMLAQLKNQDPFKPLDPSEFLGQLAQFSTVTGIQNMDASLGALSSSLRSAQVLGGTALVGRDVLAPADRATIEAGGQVRGAVDVPHGASAVTVHVRDGSGQLVRRFTVDASEGLNEFTWDGLTDSGAAAPAGQYEIEIIGRFGEENTSLQPLLQSRVSSVTIDPRGGDLVLNTTLGALPLRDVRRVM